jgi:putative sigma-54 modulation protein
MEIMISGRHLNVSDDMKAYVEEKLAKVISMFPKLTSVRVIVDHQKAWGLAEITLHGKNVELVSTGKAEDLYVAIDEAVEKMEKQLHKHVEKIHNHRGHDDKERLLEETAGA